MLWGQTISPDSLIHSTQVATVSRGTWQVVWWHSGARGAHRTKHIDWSLLAFCWMELGSWKSWVPKVLKMGSWCLFLEAAAGPLALPECSFSWSSPVQLTSLFLWASMTCQPSQGCRVKRTSILTVIQDERGDAFLIKWLFFCKACRNCGGGDGNNIPIWLSSQMCADWGTFRTFLLLRSV